MEISAEKYDSGFNLSAVHCQFARGAKDWKRNTTNVQKTNQNKKLVKVYITLLDMNHEYICKMWIPTLYNKVTNESGALVSFKSCSFSSSYVSLPLRGDFLKV